MAVFHHNLEQVDLFDGFDGNVYGVCGLIGSYCPSVEAAAIFGAFEWYVLSRLPNLGNARPMSLLWNERPSQSHRATWNIKHCALCLNPISSRNSADSFCFLGPCSPPPQLSQPLPFSRIERSRWAPVLKSALHECDPVWLEAKMRKQNSLSLYDGFRTLHWALRLVRAWSNGWLSNGDTLPAYIIGAYPSLLGIEVKSYLWPAAHDNHDSLLCLDWGFCVL